MTNTGTNMGMVIGLVIVYNTKHLTRLVEEDPIWQKTVCDKMAEIKNLSFQKPVQKFGGKKQSGAAADNRKTKLRRLLVGFGVFFEPADSILRPQ